MSQLLESIKVTVSCLCNLPLEKQTPAAGLKDLPPYQAFDKAYVKDKFPGVSPQIVAQLGKAITRRRQQLLYRRTHAEKLHVGIHALSSPYAESNKTPAETPPPRHAELRPMQARSGNVRFETTATTFTPSPRPTLPDEAVIPSVAVSEATREIRAEFPPRPWNEYGVHLGQFKCTLCHLIVSIHSAWSWR